MREWKLKRQTEPRDVAGHEGHIISVANYGEVSLVVECETCHLPFIEWEKRQVPVKVELPLAG
jgi:hypothetical protein